MRQEPVVFSHVMGSMTTNLPSENLVNIHPINVNIGRNNLLETKIKNELDENKADVECAPDTIQNFVKSV